MIDKHLRRYFVVPIESAPTWVLLTLAACAIVLSCFSGSLV
jgi:hypothetical protein